MWPNGPFRRCCSPAVFTDFSYHRLLFGKFIQIHWRISFHFSELPILAWLIGKITTFPDFFLTSYDINAITFSGSRWFSFLGVCSLHNGLRSHLLNLFCLLLFRLERMARAEYRPRYGSENYSYVLPMEEGFSSAWSTQWMQDYWQHSVTISIAYVVLIYAGQKVA